MYKFLKGIRISISLLFFLCILTIFLDFTDLIPNSWIRSITYLQFVPSLIRWFTLGGIMATGSIVIAIITLLVGRIYCSVVCPLGVFQDIISFFSGLFRRNKFKFRFSRPQNKIRYGILAIVLLTILLGQFVLLDLLDPYSVFGRLSSDFFRPLYVWGNNLMAAFLESIDVYFIYRYDLQKISLSAAIIPSVFLFTLLVFAIVKGRLYCNTLCPVGAFLGILSKFSVFRLKITDDSCSRCGKCSSACKSSCVDVKKREIDYSRCVSCFNCIKVCNNQAVRYQFAWNKGKTDSSLMETRKKRKFIRESLFITAGVFGVAHVIKAAHPKGKNLKVYRKQNLVNPPGSVSVADFNKYCTACHLCVSACPSGVLQPRFFESGLGGLLQPYMDQTAGYCNYHCTRCGEVCPTGAIHPLSPEEKKITQIGVVHFIRDNCLVYTNHTTCGSCAEHCPTRAIKMVPFLGRLTIPQTDQNICIGCGACEHACPVRPFRAIFVEGNMIQKLAQRPNNKEVEEGKTENFIF